MKRCGTKKLLKIISGGQTGVDRAALDAALFLGFPCGGVCPRGRLAEDGPIPLKYPLKESRSPFYAARTRINVENSDATLIISDREPSGGTALTAEFTGASGKPFLIIRLDKGNCKHVGKVIDWLAENKVGILNVAGPRESGSPGIHEKCKVFMIELLECYKAKNR